MMIERIHALLGLHLRSWVRSRGPMLWLVFMGSWGWFNSARMEGNAGEPWWAAWSVLAAWLGFLAGYDTYARMREDGTLRSILLHPPRRVELAGGFWGGSVLPLSVALLLFLVFIGLSRPVPIQIETAHAIGFTVLTGAAFTAYAQMASLVLPRDTSAVLGLLVVILGGTPYDHWLPATAPGWIEGAAWTLHLVLPTSNRLNELLAGGEVWAPLSVLVGQVAFSLTAIALLLNRTTLTRRPRG